MSISNLQFCLGILASFTVGLVPFGISAGEQPSPQQLEQIRQDINTLKQDLGSDKKQLQKYEQELKKLETEIASLTRKQRQTRSELTKQQLAQQQLVKETAELRQTLDRQQHSLSQQIRAGYSAGQQQALKMLLNQTDAGAAGRTITYYGYFARAQLNAAEQTQHDIKQLKNAEQRLHESRNRLETLHQEQQQQREELQHQQTQRKILLSKLNSEIKGKEQQLSKLLDDEKALTAVIHKLAPQIPATPKDFSDLDKLQGKLAWPTQGRIQNRYGQSRNQGHLKWQGVTISGEEGQDIRAIAPGRVIFADWIRGYGLMLIIDHGHGYMSLYGQNQSLYKDVGDSVSSNEVIAALGNSGGNDDASLYFEMRHKGKPVNPETWCR